MQGLGGHAHQRHDLQELLLARLAELLHVVPPLLDEGLIVAQQVGALQHPVQLQLPQRAGQGHGEPAGTDGVTMGGGQMDMQKKPPPHP